MKYNILFYLFGFVLGSYKINILETSILDFVPSVKLHHVVILKKENENEKKKNNIIYAIDFTPTGKRDFKTAVRLFLGFNAPAEIRFMPITEVDFRDTSTLIEKWETIRNEETSIEKPNEILDLFTDWKNDSMNLYCHNCQHFSRFIKMKVSKNAS